MGRMAGVLLSVRFWKDAPLVLAGADCDTVTGCFDPNKVDRLNAYDAGGQYDSSGGAGGQGNPQGSVCLG